MTSRLAFVATVIGVALGLGSASASASAIVIEPDLATAASAQAPLGGPLASVASIPYEGGPVLHANRTHVIFWAPSGSGLSFDPGYTSLVEQFLTDVAADSHATTNEYGITGEYTDSAGPAAYASTFAGGVLDPDPLPPNGCTEPALTGPLGWTVCLTDAQLQTEIKHVIATDALATGPDDIYFLVTPSGFGSCEDSTSSSCALGGSASGYCGYHSSTNSGIVYAVIPYNAVPGHCQSTNPRPNGATADPTLSTISHEQAESITDPLGDAWIDLQGNEIADVCITDYGRALGGSGATRWDETIDGHHYWLQELFSRIEDSCQPRPLPDSVTFTAPARAPAGLPVTLSARASQPGGTIVAYDWTFGDGRFGRGSQTSHTYAKAGTERVTLRVTDAAGNWAYATRTITIRRAPARDRAHRRGRRQRSPDARSPGSARTTSR